MLIIAADPCNQDGGDCRPNADTVKAMEKMIKQEGESSRVAVRSARKTVMEQVKKLSSEDTRRQEDKKARYAYSCEQYCITIESVLNGSLMAYIQGPAKNIVSDALR